MEQLEEYGKFKMKKILLIGQAPPLQHQEVPYSTTMLYEWLEEIGISKKKAQQMFDFEAMTDKLPSISSSGSHIPPSKEEMQDYYNRVLKDKILSSEKVILLGASPRNFFHKKKFFKRYDKNGIKVLSLIHPSKRNYKMYNDNKELILKLLKEMIKMKNRYWLFAMRGCYPSGGMSDLQGKFETEEKAKNHYVNSKEDECWDWGQILDIDTENYTKIR